MRRRFFSMKTLRDSRFSCLFLHQPLGYRPCPLSLQKLHNREGSCPGLLGTFWWHWRSHVPRKLVGLFVLLYFHDNWMYLRSILMLTSSSQHQGSQLKGSFFPKTTPTLGRWCSQAILSFWPITYQSRRFLQHLVGGIIGSHDPQNSKFSKWNTYDGTFLLKETHRRK